MGEIYLPVERLMDYCGNTLKEVHLPLKFQLIEVSWNARDLVSLIGRMRVRSGRRLAKLGSEQP
jgi:hypothetical protein